MLSSQEILIQNKTRLAELRQWLDTSNYNKGAVYYAFTQAQGVLKTALDRKAVLTEEVEILTMATKFLADLVDRVSVQNLRKLEDIVNNALRVIFHDQDFKFEIESQIRRGATSYSWTLSKDGIKGNINSFGGGAFAVISLILKILSQIISKKYPLLVLDESLSFVSKEYITPNLSQFLKELSEQFETTILLVTHQPAFAEEADLVYKVSLDPSKRESRVDKIKDTRSDDAITLSKGFISSDSDH